MHHETHNLTYFYWCPIARPISGVYLLEEMGSVKIDSIPEDILIQIFLCGITDDSGTIRFYYPLKTFLLSISHTNQALRRLALSTPCLWSTLSLTIHRNGSFRRDEDLESKTRNDGFVNLFRLWIERSGDSPLNYKITVNTYTQTSADVLELLFREKSRWKSITVSFCLWKSHVPIFPFELKDMSCLQSFDLTPLWAKDHAEKNIDLSKSTQLRYLRWKGVNIAQWRIIMKTIRTQQLTKLQLGLIPDNRINIVDRYFITSLGMFTNLRLLEISLFDAPYFQFDDAWNGPPVLFPNLTTLVLNKTCGKIIKHLTTPYLLSFSINTERDEGSWIHTYLRRSRPPLKNMQLAMDFLEIDDLRLILQEVPNLKTLSFTHEILYDDSRGRYDYWSLISVKDSSMDVLVPKLTQLFFNIPCYPVRSMIDEVTLLAEAVLSRKRYFENESFHSHGAHKFSRGLPSHIKDLFYSVIDEHDVLCADYHTRWFLTA